MREHKYPLMDLDDLQFRMDCAKELVCAVHDAMENSSSSTAESYLNALYGAYRYLDDLTDEMREITDLLFAERRGEAAPVEEEEEPANA